MGGEGSGRHADPVKRLLGFNQPTPTDNSAVYLPNYSGIKDSVKKITGWTTGSVVFVGATGDFTQDNSNFFWDDTNNRLGIGTASPGEKLDVVGAIRARGSAATDIANNISMDYPGYGRILVEGTDSSTNGILTFATARSNGSNIIRGMTMDGAGNVGIGTASPATLLHLSGAAAQGGIAVDGSSSPGLTFKNTGADKAYIDAITATNAVITGSAAGDLGVRMVGGRFIVSGDNGTSTDLVVTTTNRVGIGTTVPDSKLHISGGSIVYTNTTAPTLVTGSGAVFVSGGALWYLGSSGTQTRVALP